MRRVLGKIAAAQHRAAEENSTRAAVQRHQLEYRRFVTQDERTPLIGRAAKEIHIFAGGRKLGAEWWFEAREYAPRKQCIARPRLRPCDWPSGRVPWTVEKP